MNQDKKKFYIKLNLSLQDGPFINLARLNVGKYSQRPNVAKALFEYLFYHENSVREALDLAAQVIKGRSQDRPFRFPKERFKLFSP